MEVVYSKGPHPFAKGRTYQNPRHFNGPVEGAEKVYVSGSFPDIERAYAKLDVPVIKLGALGPDVTSADAAGETVRIRDVVAELRSLGIEPEKRTKLPDLLNQLAAAKAAG